MAWIESHQSLSRHRKTLRAAGRLQVDRATLIGHLHILWWWGVDNAGIDGDLGDITDFELAEAAEWSGDPSQFARVLIEVGFIDEDESGSRFLHDWYDYAGKLNERRAKERERSRARRATAQQPLDDQGGDQEDDQQTTFGTVPNRTVPNQKNGVSSSNDTSSLDATEGERSILHTLSEIPNYPFDFEKDLDLIRRLAVKFPRVDLQRQAEKWAIYKMDKPLKRNSNARSQFNNWVEIASKRAPPKPHDGDVENPYKVVRK